MGLVLIIPISYSDNQKVVAQNLVSRNDSILLIFVYIWLFKLWQHFSRLHDCSTIEMIKPSDIEGSNLEKSFKILKMRD